MSNDPTRDADCGFAIPAHRGFVVDPDKAEEFLAQRADPEVMRMHRERAERIMKNSAVSVEQLQSENKYLRNKLSREERRVRKLVKRIQELERMLKEDGHETHH